MTDDDSELGAFMLGDDVLIGLTKEPSLPFSPENAAEKIRPVRPGTMSCEPPQYILYCKGRAIPFIRLRDLKDETYTMYFHFNDKN